ncbi:MAG: TolC family outer membrane protein [Pseudomonadota bacterium]|nr:TolC family outer membrane protein [Pseudomonadota bacterium]
MPKPKMVSKPPLQLWFRKIALFATAVVATCIFGQVRAETLNGALAAAYANNPNLEAARAGLRATDESVAQARSARRPTIIGQGAAGYEDRDIHVKDPLPRDLFGRLSKEFNLDQGEDTSGYSITLNQPLYSGFQTINTIREAEANVLATRESLRNTEQSTLLSAVTAYMDVVQNMATVRLREGNVKVLADELASNKRRFEADVITRTDMAQSEAQHSASIADLDGARGSLRSSRANYDEVIGHTPQVLATPEPIDRLLPRTLPEALSIAQEEHPAIISAMFQEEAARNAVLAARGKKRPSVDLQLKYEREYDSSRLIEEEGTASVMALLKVPFYQGGSVSSQVRQALQVLSQRQSQLTQARAQVRTDVSSSWSQLASARAQRASHRVSAEANKVALDGTRREAKAGKRTVLDVLNAEQALLSAQVQLVIDERNEIVASYTLLSAIGRLSALYLRLPVELYDAEAYYKFVRKKLWGTRITPRQ